ncbi:ATP-binding protein [Desulfobacter sp.]|uniref:hybrid sensor histidine kinase/response regulator n=1 Tax=Desulfobacter sp. TaxID=2294 RepID=UPI003D12DBFB
MSIGKKIVFSATAMVLLAMVLTVSGVLILLNQGLETQTRELITELAEQSGHRLETGEKLLLNAVTSHILQINRNTTDISRHNGTRINIATGQWKALFARMAATCQRADIDFMVVFDTRGSALSAYPGIIDEACPEADFKALDMGSYFRQAIAARDLTQTGAVALFEKWDTDTCKSYALGRDSALMLLSLAVIPNEFMDEPLGYVLSGATVNRLSKPFGFFSETTGQLSMVLDQGAPLIWAGIPDSRTEVEKAVGPLEPAAFRNSGLATDLLRPIPIGKQAFHIRTVPLEPFFSQTGIGVSRALSDAWILMGEPAAIIRQASDKIITAGDATRNRILMTTLVISAMVAVLVITLMGLISRKIASPLAMAARMSNRIASGDLTPVLDESARDETGILARSMNLMVKSLKILEEQNTRQIRIIRDSEKKFRTLFNTSHQAIGLIRQANGLFMDANDKFCQVCQRPKHEIIGENPEQLGFRFEDNTLSLLEKLIRERSTDGWEMDIMVNGESCIKILLYSVSIRIKERDCFLIEFEDITEKKKLENQLKQALKMETIGTLAGGIAHDFNNILTIILSNTEMSLDELDPHHPLREYLDDVKMASLRAKEIVAQLLSFSRGSSPVLQAVDVSQIIRESIKFLRSSIPSSVRIIHDIQAAGLFVMADPIQISQIIMNLCINAYQAMEDLKGSIEIRVCITTPNPDQPVSHGDLKPGQYVRIDISDDGAGIPPTILSRIFDPYFTTKGVGKGSGLGLSVVMGIVNDHGGAIQVDSTPGKGSRFCVYLPLTEHAPEPEKTSEPFDIKGGAETILLVDDDKRLSQIFNRVLTRIGYQVKAFTDPLMAVGAFESDPDSFDLVLTDMAMPGMTGADLARAVKAIRSDIPVMVCTAYSDLMDEQKACENGIAAFVMKPISLKEMSQVIRKVLNSTDVLS